MSYNNRYDSETIRRKNSSEILNYEKIIKPLIEQKTLALDLGCGTCKKIIPLANNFDYYYGIDSNQKMLTKANENIKKFGVTNMIPFLGNTNYLPFLNSSFSFISCMLAPFSVIEAHRVLTTNGVFFLELLGTEDKKEMKVAFGMDRFGYRGILLNITQSEREESIIKLLKPFFRKVTIQNYYWETNLSKEGIKLLLNLTPTIRDFNLVNDKNVLDELFLNKENLTYREHRMIIIAKEKL